MRFILSFSVALITVVSADNSLARHRRITCPQCCCCMPQTVEYQVPPAQRSSDLQKSVKPERTTAARNAVPGSWLVTIKGKQYRIIPHPDKGDEREDERDVRVMAAAPGTAAARIPMADRFAGTARRVAKTNIIAGNSEPFTTVSEFLDWLPHNSDMVGRIGSSADTNRVQKELHNVSVDGFIYAFKKEDDNDYHVILGDSPNDSDARFVNTEVSGIPVAGSSANRVRLWDVRNAFKSAFQLGSSGPASYFRPDPPVPVRITGSIFWDVDHENPPYVGPHDFKPDTPWEIHPISEIEFSGN